MRLALTAFELSEALQPLAFLHRANVASQVTVRLELCSLVKLFPLLSSTYFLARRIQHSKLLNNMRKRSLHQYVLEAPRSELLLFVWLQAATEVLPWDECASVQYHRLHRIPLHIVAVVDLGFCAESKRALLAHFRSAIESVCHEELIAAKVIEAHHDEQANASERSKQTAQI